jgi:cysteinyl-tRNA synthetase
MEIKLYNTLSRKKEEFIPLEKGNVGLYSCGPTVYNYAHIGNLRTAIFNDVLKRTLLFLGYEVNHVMNITDVDDKTIRGAKKENLDLKKFTKKYEEIYLNDLKELNVIDANVMPRATEHIKEIVEMIKSLLKKEYAYKAEDGIYFLVSKFKNYGKLANLEKIKSTKSRVKNDEYDKKNVQDFALWKFWTKEDGDVFWETDLGKGRPGWHIECSAMSEKYLGQPFDIHTGAIDLMFPHHTNEIAQSEAANGKKFVNYWMHAGFLTMKEGKMSKSLGNIYRLIDLKERGFSALDYRYFTFTKHYRSPLEFSIENLENAKNSLSRLKNIIKDLENDGKKNEQYIKEFKEIVGDDFDMPNALQLLWKLLRDKNAEGKISTIKEMDRIFGLKLLDKEKEIIPSEIEELVEERELARKEKNWGKSDELRDKIKEKGFVIEDLEEGPRLRKI